MSNPPAGFTMTSGAWGVDADYDTSVFCAGFCSVQLKATFPAAGQTQLNYKPGVVVGGRRYRVHGMARQSSIAAGNNLYLKVGWYDRAGVWISTDYAFGPAPLAQANMWLDVGSVLAAPANAAQVQIAPGKVNGAGFSAWWNEIDLTQMVPAAAVFHNLARTIATSSDEVVRLTGYEYDYNGFLDAVNYQLVIPGPGVYTFAGQARVGTNGTWNWAEARIVKTSGGLSTIFHGPTVGPTSLGTGTGAWLPANQTFYCERGDTVQLRVWAEGTGTWTNYSGRFTIAELRI